MKKLIIILAAVLSINAASAQDRNDKYNDHDRYQATQTNNNWNGHNQGQWKDQAYNNNDKRNDQYNRQAEYDRMNQQYDQRINGYRNDRSLSSFERQRRINDVERERQQKQKSFGKALIVGGIAAIVLGAIFSN